MNASGLLWRLFFSCIGLGYFIYGKRQSNVVIRSTGIALMFYPYFFQNSWIVVSVGIALMFLPRLIKI